MFLEKKEYIKPTTYWLFSLLFILFIIILVGGLTRLTDSGLSITKWEIISGIFPPFNLEDWNKAFDKVDTNALADALKAYGIGGNFLQSIISTFRIEFRVLGVEGFPSSDLHESLRQKFVFGGEGKDFTVTVELPLVILKEGKDLRGFSLAEELSAEVFRKGVQSL